MANSGDGRRFNELPAGEQSRYRTVAQQMVGLARDLAVPIIFAPPPKTGGEINGATGTVLELKGKYFVVTASHVLEGYEKRLQSEEGLNFQVGHLPPFDPLPRIAWRDPARDTLLLNLSADEARQVGSCIASTSMGWPPPTPEVGQLVLIAGYPKVLRAVEVQGKVKSGPMSAMFRVTETGDGYFICQIEQEELISFSEGLPIPDACMDLGGLSGGPALLVQKLAYPLVGVVSQYLGSFQLLRIATLENALAREA